MLAVATTASAESLYFGGEQVHRLPPVGQKPPAGPLVRGQIDGALAGLDSAATFEDAGVACDACCSDGIGTWWDNSLIFFAADGWNMRIDDDAGNKFGLRTGINTGFALLCWLLREGIDPESCWPLLRRYSKSRKRGREYFRLADARQTSVGRSQ